MNFNNISPNVENNPNLKLKVVKAGFFLALMVAVFGTIYALYSMKILIPTKTINIISKTGSNTDFFDKAKDEFMKKNPDIKINYIGKSTGNAIDSIVKGEDFDGWICSDETGIETLQTRYEKQNNKNDIVLESKPIVTSPLVFVGWKQRMNKINDLSTGNIYEIISKNKSWQSIGGEANWGFVNFSHTDPITSNSGIQFMILLIHDFYAKNNDIKKNLTIPDITNELLMKHLKQFEKNTGKQSDGSGKLMDDFMKYGPSKYDMAAMYEYYALSSISSRKDSESKWGQLEIKYPTPTIWSNKPFVILKGAKYSESKGVATKKFMDYLFSKEIQELAMNEGYRPANPEVTNLSVLRDNFSEFGYNQVAPWSVSEPTVELLDTIRTMLQKIK